MTSEAAPWMRNAGKFDVPSSSTPLSRFALAARRPHRLSYVDQRLADADHQGVKPVGIRTIVERIEAAIDRLKRDGYGEAKCIYLTAGDMMALRRATRSDAETFKDIPVRLESGSGSKVYSRSGVARAVRKPKKRK